MKRLPQRRCSDACVARSVGSTSNSWRTAFATAVVPILRVRQDFMVGANSCSREQFPLLVSYAITVHKSQGITLDKAVCDISAPEFASGLSYVAVSRVKTLGGLMFERPFDRSRIYRETPSRAMGLKLSDHAIRQLQALDAVAGKDPSEAQRSQ